MYVNLLMVAQMSGVVLNEIPALLESIIDATVKTGADLSMVKTWCEQNAPVLFAGQSVSKLLLPRIYGLIEAYKDTIIVVEDDEISYLEKTILKTIRDVNTLTEQLCLTAVPPATVIDRGLPYMEIGNTLRKLYADLLKTAIKEAVTDEDGNKDIDFESINAACVEWIETNYPMRVNDVLFGAATAAYMNSKIGDTSDSVLWQSGQPTGIGNMFINALREEGIIGEPMMAGNKVIWHYEDEKPKSATIVNINGVWFNLFKRLFETDAVKMGEVAVQDRTDMKQLVTQLCSGDSEIDGIAVASLVDRTISIIEEGDRLIANDADGLIGYINKQQVQRVCVGEYTISSCVANDGNIVAVLV